MKSLRSRYVAAALAVFAVLMAAMLIAAMDRMTRALHDEVARSAESHARLLSAALAPLLVQRDVTAAQDLLQSLVAGGWFTYVEVHDEQGRPVASAGGAAPTVAAGTPSGTPSSTLSDKLSVVRAIDAGSADAAPLRAQNGIFHFNGDILQGTQLRGGYRFGVSDASLRQSQRKLLGGLLATGAAGLVAAALLQWVLSGLLTRRLQALSAAVDRLAAGDQVTPLAVDGDEDTARLTAGFNHLALAMQQRLQALQDADQHQRQLVEALAEGVVFVSADGRVLGCNAAACRILGLSRPQVMGHEPLPTGWHTRYPDGRPWPTEDHPGRLALRSGQAVHDLTMQVHRADGSEVWISISSQPLRAASSGLPLAAATSFSDISARIEAERSLQTYNEALEQRVAARTTELAAARDVAERANRAKTDFLSRMSHELRTPLNAILGFSQVLRLRERALPAGVGEQLGHIETAGWHLLDLINDVLDLSRIESGTLVISQDAVALAPVVAECLRMVEATARAAQVQAEADPLPPDLAVRGDSTRLRQVLVNLLSNACKYNRPGGRVRLTVKVAAEGDSVVLAVADTGVGLSAAQQAALFEPFNRLGAERGSVQGTGIGLVITKHLVELMGGTLAVVSEPGVGSTFSLHLLRADLASAPPAPDAAALAAADDVARWTLLYVEDNSANQQLLAEVLKLRPTVRLLCATDGLQGLTVAAAQRPDIVVVDISLPGIDGYALCRRLRALPALQRQPIVALSANAMSVDRKRGLEAGFDRYFTKPLDVSQFLAWLDETTAGLGR